jgi:hypothetical protein
MEQCHVREKRRGARLYTVPIKFTPDAHGTRIGADLKTTVCEDLQEFTQKAFEYGYFRQGDTYSLAVGGLKEFWIIGIGKKPPYTVLPICINQHADKMHYVREELKFLLYIYKHYGNPIRQKTAHR